MKLILILLFVFTGCAQSNKKRLLDEQIIGVEDSKDQKQKVTLNSQENGLSELDKIANSKNKKKKSIRVPAISLLLPPARMGVSAYANFFSELEKKNIAPHIITGYGFGALAGALYSVGKGPNWVEWQLYHLYKELKKNSRINTVEKFINKVFKDLSFIKLKKTFYILEMNPHMKSISFNSRGSLSKALIESIRDSYADNDKLVTISKFINENEFKKIGADITILMLPYTDEFKLNEEQDFKKFESIQYNLKENSKFSYKFSYNEGLVELDDIEMLSGNKGRFQDSNQFFVTEIKKIIYQWQEVQE